MAIAPCAEAAETFSLRSQTGFCLPGDTNLSQEEKTLPAVERDSQSVGVYPTLIVSSAV